MNPLFTSLSQGYAQVFQWLQQQQLPQARTLAHQLVHEYPEAATAYVALAAVASETGELAAAENAMQQALELEPYNGTFLFNLIQLLQGQGKADAMLQLCRQLPAPETMTAVDSDLCLKVADVLWNPHADDNTPALAWLGLSLKRYPQDQEILAFREPSFYLSANVIGHFLALAAPLYPQRVKHWRRAYVQLCFHRKDFEAALPFLAASLENAPDFAPLVYKALRTLWDAERFYLAQPYFAALGPYIQGAPLPAHSFYRDWAVCAHRNNDLVTFETCFTKARHLAPDPLYYAIDKIVQFPRVYESEAHIQKLREAFQSQLNHLEAEVDARLNTGQKPNIRLSYPFGLAYQGFNDLELVSQLGRIGHKALHGTAALQNTDYAPRRKAPFKVGFVSHYFYKHSVLRVYGKGIAYFAEDEEFEIYVIHTGSIVDQDTHQLAEAVDHFVHETDPQKVLQQLKSWQLDALIYTDVGMDPTSYFLAQHRIAPIQGILSGHPVTSGIPHLDYFFSGKTGDDNIQAHYSEKTILLKGGFSPLPPLEPAPEISRSLFSQVTEHTHIYFCPMLLFKVHPSFDHALKAILTQDPQAHIYFVDIPKDPITTRGLKKRFAKTVGTPLCDRIFFMPWMGRADFRSAVASADVLLDTFCFGSGSTTIQILELHQPLVTLPGEFYRARIALTYYLRLKMQEPVAQSVDDYVQKAVRIACDPDYRHRLRQELAEKLPAFRKKRRSSIDHLKTELKDLFESYPAQG